MKKTRIPEAGLSVSKGWETGNSMACLRPLDGCIAGATRVRQKGMWRGLEKWPGAGSHRPHTPWRSWDLEMTGSLMKDFKQRDMVRLVLN